MSVARTGDGLLHVAWLRKNGTLQDLVHTAIAQGGKTVGSPVAIQTGWQGIANPDLIVSADGGLRVFFGGIRSLDPSDPNAALNTATAGADGTSWTLLAGRVSASTSTYVVPVGAGLTADGTPVTVWGDASPGMNAYHIGLDPTAPDTQYHAGGCCVYDADVATDAVSGEVVIGWYSNETGAPGIFFQTIAPAAGPKRLGPGSTTKYAGQASSVGVDQRLPITGRLGAAGVFAAFCGGYPVCEDVLLWRYGTPKPLVVAKGGDVENVDVAAAPQGRLWVLWEDGGTFYAARTNKQADRVGAVVSFEPPKGADPIWGLEGEGSLGPLDVLAHVTTPGSLATWHTQVLPGLTLAAKPAKLSAEKGGKVVFAVTDAGEPVAGAKVKVGAKTGTTNAKGKAALSFPAGTGNLTAKASKRGYTGATARVAVA